MDSQKFNGLPVKTTAHLLRTYAYIERRCIKALAGWFLVLPRYEDKYSIAYHLLDHAEHVTWLRARLSEMRAGLPDAATLPALHRVMEEVIHAPDSNSFLMGLYGVVKKHLLQQYKQHLEQCDPSANAVEVRILKRMIPEIESQLDWYEKLKIHSSENAWVLSLEKMISAMGGIEVTTPLNPFLENSISKRFERPKTILFDPRIRIGELTAYEVRQQMDEKQSLIEQFKVFFNEFYAASLLASILYDGFEDGYPWELYADFCRHFWDEVRHSEFGSIRLRELGIEPSVCNPVLFEQSESLPVLHRICYLTRGLEGYFMPRKQPRVKEYEARGDHRSQLFADQDWSDEISHVRYGNHWGEFLLENDHRTIEDILEESLEHISQVTGKSVEKISAPF